ncbi:tripartite tricarboxylate transporter substrate-binding protein [Belnapia sp. F-4-1]|uniref:tripartite tricarboxylate transporter substrate-binding protein n=1 Tax=Belnapia sp. F-4-1 TaxID=1545443 RepID=UPI00068F66BC|nr:tripartite tricarboxylate transporter substrate-binding protein [Belnapia sp. F-4-1]
MEPVGIRSARRLCRAGPAAFPALPALAQDLPQRPIRLIVPFAAGGGTDVVAQVVAEQAGRLPAQPVAVEHRTGVGSILGMEHAAKAAPDGGTRLVATLAHAVNPALHDTLPYDLLRDFRSVAFIGEVPLVLLVDSCLPAEDLRGLVPLLRREPGRHACGSGGSGSAIHVAGELFRRMADVGLLHVLYRGAASALQDVIAAERGFPDFGAVGWNGLFLPAHTPPAIVARLAYEARAALHRPDVKAQVERQSGDVVGRNQRTFARFVRTEVVRWAEVVRRNGIQVE